MRRRFVQLAALLFLLALWASVEAQTPGISVSARLVDGQGNLDRNALLHWDLWNCGANVPQVIDVRQITALSLSANLITVTANNDFTAGQKVTLSGLTTNPSLNGTSLTILSSGLSSTQFRASLTHATISSHAETGTATVSGAIVAQQFDMRPDPITGLISGSVYGNNQISCGGVTSTAWLVTQYKASTQPLANPHYYCLTAPGTFDPALNAPCQPTGPALPWPQNMVPIWSNPYPGLSQSWVQPAGTEADLIGNFYLNGSPLNVGMTWPTGSGIPTVVGGNSWGPTLPPPDGDPTHCLNGTGAWSACALVPSNTVTGSGTLKEIAYWDSGTSITSNQNFRLDTALGHGGYVLLGNNAVGNGAIIFYGFTSGSTLLRQQDAAGLDGNELWLPAFPAGWGPQTIVATVDPPLVKDNTTGNVTCPTCSTDPMQFPPAGVPNSTGSAWGTSYAVGSTANDLPQLDSGGKLLSSEIPNNAANTTGTAANLSGTPTLPNGTMATTQAPGDATAKIATDDFVTLAIAAALGSIGSGVTSISGTTNEIVVTGTTTPVLSLSPTLALPSGTTVPTPLTGDNSTKAVNSAWVNAQGYGTGSGNTTSTMTAGKIPLATGTHTLGDSALSDDGTQVKSSEPFVVGSAADPSCVGIVNGICMAEDSNAGTPTAGHDYIRPDSVTHKWVMSLNGGGEVPVGTGGGSVTSVTCGTGLSGGTFTTTGTCSTSSSNIVGLFTSCSGTQYLGADGACHTASGGTVTSVGGTSPVLSSGGATPTISISGVTGEQGNGSKLQLSTGTVTQNLVTKFDANGNTVNGSMTDDGTHSVVTPNGIDVNASGGLIWETPNNAATGTVANKMACDDGTGKAIICNHTTCATNVPIGVAVATNTCTPGTTGCTGISLIGFNSVIFDNAATARHYAQCSTTVDGDLHDVGTTQPTNSQPFYPVYASNSGAGTAATIRDLTGDELATGGSGGSKGTVTNTGGALTLNSLMAGAGGNDSKVLASDPTQCTGSQFATGVDKTGAAKGCATPAGTYTLPTATSSVLGGVKPDGTSILNSSGVISATAASVGAVPTTTTVNGHALSSNVTVTIGDLGAQYSKLRCQTGLGDGLNAIAAGTYLQSFCYNDSGVTWVITAVKCYTDNNGTSTLQVDDDSGNHETSDGGHNYFTCSNSWAAGTQNGSQWATGIPNGHYAKFTWISDGASKQTTWHIGVTQ